MPPSLQVITIGEAPRFRCAQPNRASVAGNQFPEPAPNLVHIDVVVRLLQQHLSVSGADHDPVVAEAEFLHCRDTVGCGGVEILGNDP